MVDKKVKKNEDGSEHIDIYRVKRKRRTFTDKSRFYIDKEEYEKEILDYKNTGKASERLGELFMLHVQRCSSAHNWKSYTYRNDMEGLALYHLLKFCHNYNPNFVKKDKDSGSDYKPGAFSYCTTIIHHAFLQTMAKEKKQSKIKDVLIKNQERINNNKLTLNITDDNAPPKKDD
jgi:hypothetical protein